jgi:hypothetical protein
MATIVWQRCGRASPNGLAHDSLRNVLLAANVGDPAIPGSATASIVDVAARSVITTVAMPGRTRWALFF